MQDKGIELELNLDRRSKDTACTYGTYSLLTEILGRPLVDIFDELGARNCWMVR